MALMFLKPRALCFRSTMKNIGAASVDFIRALLIFPSKNSFPLRSFWFDEDSLYPSQLA
jgi:hypothetical protein